MGDRVRRFDGCRWGIRTIRPGGIVRWLRDDYLLESGTMPMNAFMALTLTQRTALENNPAYDGRLDGLRAVFYSYGIHAPSLKDHIYLHSVEGAEWPGPQCVKGVFVWDSFKRQ